MNVKSLKLFSLSIIILLFSFQIVSAQSIKDTSISIPMISGAYSIQVPGGDLAQRFGINSNVGASFIFKTRSNWLIGIEGNFLFGSDIKEDGIFDSIKTSDGQIINIYGEYAKVLLTERGFFIGAKIGKLFPVFGSNPNSGIMVNASCGLLQHKIRIENDGNNALQIIDDYTKGYDRLTNGIAISEFIGYMHLSKNHLVNLYAGFEFYQAWTKNRRDFNFDTMEKDARDRKDFLYSFKFGWIIPLYKKMPDKFYTY